MDVNWRVTALEALMQRAGYHITKAATLQEVQRLRQRRQAGGDGLRGRVMTTVGGWLFGRLPVGITVADDALPGPAGPLSFRRYVPPGSSPDGPLVVLLHGGGWVLGSLDGSDPWCGRLALALRAVVVSVDYRLAPEHRAPAAVDDAVAATRWFATHGAEMGATGPLVLAGDSAGANLATLVAIACRDAGGTGGAPIAAQLLVYPAVDLSLSFPSTTQLADAPVLRRVDLEAFLAHYLGDEVAADDPRVSPWMVDDVAGVAPALVQVAEQDPLVDEGRAWARRLAEAGVPVRVTEYVGQPHGFLSLPGVCGDLVVAQAVAEQAAFVRARLAELAGLASSG
jgi:acetyl esterase/lipase